MKKYIVYTIALVGIISLFSACSNENGPSEFNGEYGYLSLNLAVAQSNQVTMTKADAVDVDEFSVEVRNAEDNAVVKSFATFRELKESGTLRLDKGNYKVVVSEQGEMPEVSVDPYYAGVKENIAISANYFTPCEVECFMQQVRVKVKFEQELMDVLAAIPADICVSNGNQGGEHTFSIDNNSGESDEIYIKPTGGLRLSFSVAEKEYGESIQYNELIKKAGDQTPEANDFLTVTLGLDKGTTKSLSTRSENHTFNIKVTVE